MVNKINRIEIQFPQDVELTGLQETLLQALVNDMCKAWEVANPHRVMWPAGYGQKMKFSPFLTDEDHPMEYDAKTLTVEVFEREDYKVTDKPSLKSVTAEVLNHEVYPWVVELIEKAFAAGLKDRELPQEYRRELVYQHSMPGGTNLTEIQVRSVSSAGCGFTRSMDVLAPDNSTIETEVWIRRPKRKVD